MNGSPRNFAPHPAVPRGVGGERTDRGHVSELGERLHQPVPGRGEEGRHDVVRPLRREQQQSLAQELLRAVALGDVVEAVDLLVEQRGDDTARVQRQVPSNLTARVGEALLQEEQRGRDAPAGQDHRPGTHPERGSIRGLPLDADGPAVLDQGALGLQPGEEHGAPRECRREIREVRAPPGVARAAEMAEARGLAARSVPDQLAVLPAEGVTAPLHHPGERPGVAQRRRTHPQMRLDALEVRLHP